MEWEKYEKELCDKCKERIIKKMKPLNELQNSKSKYKQAKGLVKLACMQKNLWKKVCPECLRRLKKAIKR